MGAAEASADPSDAAEPVTLIGKSEPQLRSLLSLTEQGGSREDSFLSPELYIGEILRKTCSKCDFS